MDSPVPLSVTVRKGGPSVLFTMFSVCFVVNLSVSFYRVCCQHDCTICLHVQGTSSEQDARFYNKEKKLKKSLKYPPNIGVKVRVLINTCHSKADLSYM